jgi:GMP synthase (glutamine-hydrolysing)
MTILVNDKKVLVIQHTKHEHLGLIAETLDQEQVKYMYVRPDQGQSIPTTLDGYNGLIVMGGPQGVYQEDIYPFLRPEKALLRQAIQTRVPILGVCLGSQLLAETLGSRVYPGGSFELGWKEVTLSAEAKEDHVLGHLPNVIIPLHWHSDSFDLPEGATPIGASDMSPVQGFSWKGKVYGLLFHLEMTLEQISAMVVDFHDDLNRSKMRTSEIISAASDRLAALREPGIEVFRRWTTLL